MIGNECGASWATPWSSSTTKSFCSRPSRRQLSGDTFLVSKDLVRTKLGYIAANVAILESKKGLTESEFANNTDYEYVILHALQLAIQAALDLAAHVVADEGWAIPERSGEAFLTLGQNGILEFDLSNRL